MYRIRICVFVMVILYSPVFAAEEPMLNEVGVPEQHTIDVEGDVSVSKNEFLLGEPISIEVAVTNRHSEPVHILDMIEESGFQFSAQDSSGKRVKEFRRPYLTGMFPCVQAQPGSTLRRVVFMHKQLDFPGPGVYEVEYRGCIYSRKISETCPKVSVHDVPLSGVITVKLRKPTGDELEKALTEFVKQLKSGNRELERRAARALSVSEPTLAIKLLKQAVTDESGAYPSYTSEVTWALGKIGGNQATQALLDLALHGKHRRIRTDAIYQLGKQHIKEAVPTLLSLLPDEDVMFRVAALQALGRIKDKSTLPQIEARLTDPNKKVREAAEKALKALTKDRSDK